MYWLIEGEEQLKVLLNSGFKEAFVEVIPYNNTTHPILNKVSLVYIRPLTAHKGFMVCVSHHESLNALDTDLYTLLNEFNILYCRDKKEMLHYYSLKNLYDITPPPYTYILPTTRAHDIFYDRHKDEICINTLIPIVKHYELCEQIFEDLKTNINRPKTKYDEFFNTKVSLVFNYIERNGIRVCKPTFEEHFHKIDNPRVYTQYNLRTTTTRPSNKFQNVNYASLSHKNGCRKSFIPSNNLFVDIDISAYHPSLSCRLIDYNFPSMDIHAHLQELYKVDYAKSKELTFKQLYGGVFKEYKDLEFFKRISIYVKELWSEFEGKGEIMCPISNFVYKKETLVDMNPQKLFNYLLQNLETSMNVLILWDMIGVLRGKKTKLVLYTFDSFLFDWDESEIELIEGIKNIFSKYKFNIKIKQGYDYDFK
jgi:hypothetical protein